MTALLEYMLQMIRQGVPCLFRCVTGLYCPGCGGTRALGYLLHGHIGKSLWYHPLVGYMAAVIAVEAVRWITERWRRNGQKASQAEAERSLKRYGRETYVGVAVILVNWVVKNGVLMVWGVEIIP